MHIEFSWIWHPFSFQIYSSSRDNHLGGSLYKLELCNGPHVKLCIVHLVCVTLEFIYHKFNVDSTSIFQNWCVVVFKFVLVPPHILSMPLVMNYYESYGSWQIGGTSFRALVEGEGRGWLVFKGRGNVLVPSGVQRCGGGWFGLASLVFPRWPG